MQRPATHYERQGLKDGGNKEAEAGCLRRQGGDEIRSAPEDIAKSVHRTRF